MELVRYGGLRTRRPLVKFPRDIGHVQSVVEQVSFGDAQLLPQLHFTLYFSPLFSSAYFFCFT
jgi:hypothetical protein